MTSDGTVTSNLPNPAVTEEVLMKVLAWKATGKSEDAIIKCLRQETVPQGFKVHSWTPGTVDPH